MADELYGYNRDRAYKRVETIYDSLMKIYEISKTENLPTYLAANRLAESRIERVAKMRNTFLQNEKSILNRR